MLAEEMGKARISVFQNIDKRSGASLVDKGRKSACEMGHSAFTVRTNALRYGVATAFFTNALVVFENFAIATLANANFRVMEYLCSATVSHFRSIWK